MEKIIKEGKSVEAALSALMEENNLSKEEFLFIEFFSLIFTP